LQTARTLSGTRAAMTNPPSVSGGLRGGLRGKCVEAAAQTSAIKGLLWLFRFGCVADDL
jgi:hypothetical protein